MKGAVDIANASRNMKPSEVEQANKNTGKPPEEFMVGYDALAIYVHKDNPLNEITLEQLARSTPRAARSTSWSELGVKIPGRHGRQIVRVSRQSSSGTYEFFREHVLKNKDFRNGSRDMNGSKEVVELVGSTPTAIGYSGMGYATPAVKMLKVAKKNGATRSSTRPWPTVHDKTYPARALAPRLHARRAAGGGEELHRLDPVGRGAEGGRGGRLRAGTTRPAPEALRLPARGAPPPLFPRAMTHA